MPPARLMSPDSLAASQPWYFCKAGRRGQRLGSSFLRRFGEPAAQRPEPLEADRDIRTGIDEVIVVTAGTVGDGAEAHRRARLERCDEAQPGKHGFGLVTDLGGRPLILDLTIHHHRHLELIGIANLIGVTRYGPS